MTRIRQRLLVGSSRKTDFALFAAAVVTVGVVIGPAAASKALAGDYKVAYAIDARDVRETGKYVECTYGAVCLLKFERTSIHIFIGINGTPTRHAILVAVYDNRNCCYFSDGDNKIQLYDNKPYYQLPIFEGRRRLGSEYVHNLKIGDIFLAFTDFHL